MIRIALIPAFLAGGPVLAHSTTAAHVHDTSALSLVMGLVLIAAGIGAATLVRGRSK